eukprot:1116749-Ditylum_brightwellii.AAC.1
MAKVWNKIGHADKKHDFGSIMSLQIPVTWPSSDSDVDQIGILDNPKKVQHWKPVETPHALST